jgi:hypothetical protein
MNLKKASLSSAANALTVAIQFVMYQFYVQSWQFKILNKDAWKWWHEQ